MNELDFNEDDQIDITFINNFLLYNENILHSIEEDFQKYKIKFTFRNAIGFYNQNMDFNQIATDNGVLQNISNLINKMEYVKPEKEKNYLSNVSVLLMLKYLTNALTKTQNAILMKIEQLKIEANKEENKGIRYNNLLKWNINKLFTDGGENTKPRPESATPSNFRIPNRTSTMSVNNEENRNFLEGILYFYSICRNIY
jgi:hypothetical protein